jgi:hypothetical protein
MKKNTVLALFGSYVTYKALMMLVSLYYSALNTENFNSKHMFYNGLLNEK